MAFSAQVDGSDWVTIWKKRSESSLSRTALIENDANRVAVDFSRCELGARLLFPIAAAPAEGTELVLDVTFLADPGLTDSPVAWIALVQGADPESVSFFRVLRKTVPRDRLSGRLRFVIPEGEIRDATGKLYCAIQFAPRGAAISLTRKVAWRAASPLEAPAPPPPEPVLQRLPAGRKITPLPFDLLLVCRSDAEARACEVSRMGEGGTVLHVDPRRCTRGVRILRPLPDMEQAMAALPPGYKLPLAVEFTAADESPAGASSLVWAALTQGPEPNSQAMLRVVKTDLKLGPQMETLRFSVAVDNLLQPGNALYLTLQLVEGGAPVRIGAVDVALDGTGGALTEASEDLGIKGSFRKAERDVRVVLWRGTNLIDLNLRPHLAAGQVEADRQPFAINPAELGQQLGKLAWLDDKPIEILLVAGSVVLARRPLIRLAERAVTPDRSWVNEARDSFATTTEATAAAEGTGPPPTPKEWAERYRQVRRNLLQLERLALSPLLQVSQQMKRKRGAKAAADPRDAARASFYAEHLPEVEKLIAELGRNFGQVKEGLTGIEQVAAPAEKKPARSGEELLPALTRMIDGLQARTPSPYYQRLRKAVATRAPLDALVEITNTLSTIDKLRQGWRPKADGPLVSIVMPTYNRADLILEAVQSVRAQSYVRFELIICDDASEDRTLEVLAAVKDPRIKVVRQEHRQGAAAARNRCLAEARGEIIAYLDSDNLWHPRYLEIMLERLAAAPGFVAAYAGFLDLRIDTKGAVSVNKSVNRPFFYEDQIDQPFLDLNSFVNRRILYELHGGFDATLERRQDYDLIARYCWSREPLHVACVMNLYQRIDSIEQITRVQKNSENAVNAIARKLDGYYQSGLPAKMPSWLRKISVISWDLSRNHFAKAYSVADALSRHMEVELISFRFFEEAFEPLAGRQPRFETKYFEGSDFPDFFDAFCRGLTAITGDAIYAVKPRLPSFGLGLLANYHTGKPLFLEVNDLETVVSSPRASDIHDSQALEALLAAPAEARVPHAIGWSHALDPLVAGVPVVFTHNVNLHLHYDQRCLYMRNVKDETIYDPSGVDRDRERAALGIGPEDRVILFGGLVRRHKGIFELVELLDKLGDPRWKLLVAGNRETPDLRKLSQMKSYAGRVILLPPQPPERMAALNAASDVVVLWLDPAVSAGWYQSPYKMSDALAMGPLIVASPLSDLAHFADRGLMLSVPFGDFDGLAAALKTAFQDEAGLRLRRERARRFFRREFSYNAVHSNLALGAHMVRPGEVYPVATRFADVFAKFQRRLEAGAP